MAAQSNDDRVLDVIFNPTLPDLASNLDVSEQDQLAEDEQIDAEILNQVKEMEIEGVKAAESGNLDRSLQVFNNAINLAPSYAASYNNRAQLHRIRGNV